MHTNTRISVIVLCSSIENNTYLQHASAFACLEQLRRCLLRTVCRKDCYVKYCNCLYTCLLVGTMTEIIIKNNEFINELA